MDGIIRGCLLIDSFMIECSPSWAAGSVAAAAADGTRRTGRDGGSSAGRRTAAVGSAATCTADGGRTAGPSHPAAGRRRPAGPAAAARPACPARPVGALRRCRPATTTTFAAAS